LPSVPPNKFAIESIAACMYEIAFTKYRDTSWKQRMISPCFRPFELAAVSSRRNDFLLDSAFSLRVPPLASHSSFAIRKIGERSIYERIVRPNISIPLPCMNIRPSHPSRLLNPRSLSKLGDVRVRHPTGTTFSPLQTSSAELM